MQPELVDSHTHLDAEQFDHDREEVIQRALDMGVTRIINVGAINGVTGSKRSILLAEAYSCIWATVGIHPHDAEISFDISALKSCCYWRNGAGFLSKLVSKRPAIQMVPCPNRISP